MTTSDITPAPSSAAPVLRHQTKSAVLRLRLTRADKSQIRRDAKKLGCAMSTLLLALYRAGRTSFRELAS